MGIGSRCDRRDGKRGGAVRCDQQKENRRQADKQEDGTDERKAEPNKRTQRAAVGAAEGGGELSHVSPFRSWAQLPARQQMQRQRTAKTLSRLDCAGEL